MKQKYSQNHKAVIFQTEDIVTFRIPKEDRAATDNHRVGVMIKSIPNKRRHKIQTRFGVLDCLYPTGELNVIPSIDQESYRSSFVGVPTKLISLYEVSAKIRTSNKVAVHCSCKKMCTPQFRCKCRKSRVQCSQYYHNSHRDYGNAGLSQKGTEAEVLPRSKDDSEMDSTIGERESSKTRPGKNQKKPRALTNSNRKRKKVTVTVVQDRNKGSEGDMEQTTLFQYKNTAQVVNHLQGLRDRSHRGRLRK